MLHGSGDVARYLNVASVEEADALKKDLTAIVKAWVELKSGNNDAPKKKAAKKKAAKKKAAKKKKS